MNDEEIKDIAAFGMETAKEAGFLIRQMRQSGGIEVNYKGVRDLLTSADLAADKLITGKIRSRFSDHLILSEESSAELFNSSKVLTSPLWVIDPIDGTTNYAHGHQMVGVSIAFALYGKVVFGVVDAPFLGETFSAICGGGAFLNGKRIYCSGTLSLQQSLVATGFPYQRDDIGIVIKRLESVLSRCRDIRRLGAASLDLCWVACSRLDAYYEDLKPWDMAAGALIAREAGAAFGHINPEGADEIPSELNAEGIVVSAPAVFEEMLKVLRECEVDVKRI